MRDCVEHGLLKFAILNANQLRASFSNDYRKTGVLNPSKSATNFFSRDFSFLQCGWVSSMVARRHADVTAFERLWLARFFVFQRMIWQKINLSSLFCTLFVVSFSTLVNKLFCKC